jgi:octaprenyl-diphosphate synthase
MHSKPAIKQAIEPLNLTKEIGSPLISKVDKLILGIVKEEIPLIHDIAEHIIASGGKRLRPLLTLLCADICGYDGDRHIKLAAAVEFIHTATLLHDDVVDESKLRRGLATANDVWGNKSSVLVGDFILSQAFRLMVADGSLEVLDILSNAAAVISKGEVLQLATEGDASTSMERYLQVISAKTAELFAAACEIAPVLVDKSEWRPAFRAYGESLGIAFQMVDDLLDYQADESKLGKTIGDDFRERKVTLPMILAMQQANTEERHFWQRVLSSDHYEGDLTTALQLLQKYKVAEQVKQIAEKYCAHAEQQITQMPQTHATYALREILDFCRSRVF